MSTLVGMGSPQIQGVEHPVGVRCVQCVPGFAKVVLASPVRHLDAIPQSVGEHPGGLHHPRRFEPRLLVDRIRVIGHPRLGGALSTISFTCTHHAQEHQPETGGSGGAGASRNATEATEATAQTAPASGTSPPPDRQTDG